MDLLIEFIITLIAVMGFSYSFNAPKKAIIYGGIIGGIGWCIYLLLYRINESKYISSFVAAFVIAIISEFMARRTFLPSSCYTIPAILVLVPGSGIYFTMNLMVNGHNEAATHKLFETLLICGAISFGIILASVWSKSINSYKKRNQKRKIANKLVVGKDKK